MYIPMLANAAVADPLSLANGYVYPNELNLLWSVLIVLYPYITGLVAGAFILASLVRVFDVKALEPAYRLSLLTAFGFLLAAPLPLLCHLGRPERFYEIMMTPHLTSPMAMFGFVYAWYLMAVVLLELWFDYRRDFIIWSRMTTGWRSKLYGILTLGVHDTSPAALKLDDKIGRAITIIGIPSAFLLHGYVGFIFGSIKANPWWGTVLMPIIFIFSAMVSGIALCAFFYMTLTWFRRETMDMKCIDAIGKFLFYALVIDASIETLDWIHRLYEAEESIHVLKLLASDKLFDTFLIGQAFLGTVLPLVLLAQTQLFRDGIAPNIRRIIYFSSSVLILIGVLAMRWNVVIGGQLFSKSFRGFTSYKMELAGHEGLAVALVLFFLPFVILSVLVKFFLPAKNDPLAHAVAHDAHGVDANGFDAKSAVRATSISEAPRG